MAISGLTGADHASQTSLYDLFTVGPVSSPERPSRITVFGGRRPLQDFDL